MESTACSDSPWHKNQPDKRGTFRLNEDDKTGMFVSNGK